MIRLSRFALALGLATVAACTVSEKTPPADSTVATAPQPVDPVPALPDTTASTTPAAPAPPAPPSADTTPTPPFRNWLVRARGYGPIAAGMTLDEANNVSGNRLVVPAKPEECDYAKIRGAPDGILVMIEKGTISRIDITKGAVVTAAGAKIGDTEARIKSLYPGLVTTQPHKYTDGHYLVVTPGSADEKGFRIVFETDGSKVLRYRSGRVPAVEYVEGCS